MSLLGTTNEDQMLDFNLGTRDSVIEEHHKNCNQSPLVEATAVDQQTLDTHVEPLQYSSSQPKYLSAITSEATVIFSTFVNIIKIYTQTCSMEPIRK
jgi:hypothetical protein